MNAAQVRNKARAAVQRREDAVEQEEVEGGEINLVPYLDIVTNLMLFLLASLAVGILGQLDTTLPEHAPSNAVKPAQPDKPPEEQLQPVVSISKSRLLLWSISGLEGSLAEPKAQIARIPGAAGTHPTYDYPKLNAALYEIASRRWKGKLRPMATYEIILQADGEIPYETIVEVIDNVRRRLPDTIVLHERLDPVAMPATEGEKKDITPTENYDPDKHFLFPDILFSLGFE